MKYRDGNEVWKDTSKALANPPRGILCPSWPRFNQFTGGMRPHELTLLCAPTGAGKTQLLANISVQLLQQGVPHFVAPVETGDCDYLARVASVISERDLNDGEKVDSTTLKTLGEGFARSGFLDRIFLATHDNRVDIHEMLNLLKFMVQEHQIKVALLDNLNFFLKVTSAQNERAEMDNAMHDFVMLVKHVPVHVILIVHPKKTDGEGRVESEFDIKGSSTAVQEAYNVCLFNRPTRADVEAGKASPTHREMMFRKIRKRGVHVGKVIRFKFDGGQYLEIQ